MLLARHQQEGICWLEQQHKRVGRKEVGSSSEMLLIQQQVERTLLGSCHSNISPAAFAVGFALVALWWVGGACKHCRLHRLW